MTDGKNILIWAKQRLDYVRKVEFVNFRLKDAANFGIYNNAREDGEFCNGSWSTLMQLKPKIIEIGGNVFAAQAFNDFASRLTQEGHKSAKNFLTNLTYLHISDLSSRVWEHIKLLIENADKLSTCEIESISENESESDKDKLISELADVLKNKPKLKALSFQFPLSKEQIEKIVESLKLQLRIVRFDGPTGFRLADIMNIRDELPCVELLALQAFDRRIRDDDDEDENDSKSPSHVVLDGAKLVRRLGAVFCGLKVLLIDWNVFDTCCIFDDQARLFCTALLTVYRNLKLQFLAVLVYAPDVHTQTASDQMRDFFEKENEADDVKVRCEEFSLIAGTPPNFRLIFFGDFHFQARTKRMVEIIVEKRTTRPSLRHLCYILDSDNLLNPDITLEFAGFETKTVMKRYEQAIEFNQSTLANEQADQLKHVTDTVVTGFD